MEVCKPKSFEECPRYIPERKIIDDSDSFNPIYTSATVKSNKKITTNPFVYITKQFNKKNNYFINLLLLLLLILLSIKLNEHLS